ncbi:MAG: membrane-bound PQQ-dependent dehydrogenase, glucose/quinate/shikimate family, partial [Novosphingobium sp.]
MGENGAARTIGRTVYGLLLALIGLALALGGAKLIWLGGSWYYLFAGLLTLLSGYNVLKRNWWTGAAIYGVILLITLTWALFEARLDGWALMPRVVSPLVLGLPFLIVALTSRIKADRLGGWLVVGTAAVLALAVWANSGFAPVSAATYPVPGIAGPADGDWLHFGNDQGGRHFSALSTIDQSNVGKLAVAWTAPLGPMPTKPVGQIDATPLKVGDHLYVCSPFNDVLDLEPDTGKVRWQFHAPRNNSGLSVVRCRGVAYYAVPGASGLCARRVYTVVSDGAHLVALDAETGVLCPGFGTSGLVDTLKGMQQRNAGYYGVSSAPTVIRGKLV